MPNLYGDILSDVAAQIAGSVGLAGSANIGDTYAMFEAIHGSAPRRANQNLANPSGLLLGAVMMLVHIDQPEVAARIHNAWLKTLEDGIHTYDTYTEEHSTQKVGTKEFAQAVAARMGQLPEKLTPVSYQGAPKQTLVSKSSTRVPEVKEMVGIDLFLDWTKGTANELGGQLEPLAGPDFKLMMISNRGVKVYPGGFPDTLTCDTWRCRFMRPDGGPVTHAQIVGLLDRTGKAGYDFLKIESLCNFDSKPVYSLSQGQ